MSDAATAATTRYSPVRRGPWTTAMADSHCALPPRAMTYPLLIFCWSDRASTHRVTMSKVTVILQAVAGKRQRL